jgi:2-octaprenyl-6-methoxyphenol hydroxylase
MLVQKPAQHYDIVIVGGGMVGASFALLMRQRLGTDKGTMLVVEASMPDPGASSSPGFDDRSTALSYGSRGILQDAGLWPRLTGAITPIHEIHVSDRGHFGSACLDSRTQGVEALGYVVENRSFGTALGETLLEHRSIDLIAPANVETIAPTPVGMSLTLRDEAGVEYRVEAGLVVLADGGRSPICRSLGIETERREYGQRAIIANVAHEKPHAGIAYERFTDTGPLAILPLQPLDGEQRGALIWTVTESESGDLMALQDHDLIPILQDRFGYRLGRFSRLVGDEVVDG